jgi:tetratricopeptide (TPR) repeat protein
MLTNRSAAENSQVAKNKVDLERACFLIKENEITSAIEIYQTMINTMPHYGPAYEALLPLLKKQSRRAEYLIYRDQMLRKFAVELLPIYPVNEEFLESIFQELVKEKKIEQLNRKLETAYLLARENKIALALKICRKVLMDSPGYGPAYEMLLPLLKKHTGNAEYVKTREKMLDEFLIEVDSGYGVSDAFLKQIFTERMFEMNEEAKTKSFKKINMDGRARSLSLESPRSPKENKKGNKLLGHHTRQFKSADISKTNSVGFQLVDPKVKSKI